MGFNQRTPNPIDPAVDPLLPQADSSQAHDIPTGVSPTTAKLQDWIAWLSGNGVFYTSPGVIANDIEIDGDLEVTGKIGVRGGLSAYRNSHGTLAANATATDADYLHSFDGASASVDIILQFDPTTPGLIHCYCTSASLANEVEFRYSGIHVGTWPAGANRPYVVFVMGALLPEPVSHGGGTTFP